MLRQKYFALLTLTSLLLPGVAIAQGQGASHDAIAKITDEGMNRSQAMSTIRYLTDVIGPRLTNSPGQKRANQWTKEQFEKWGMKNAAIDPWGEFGRGWELKSFTANVTAAGQTTPFRAYPKAWSPSTNGAVTSDVIYVDATDEAGLEKYKGKLKGAIVLTAPERSVSNMFKPYATRTSDEDLEKMENAKPATPGQPQGQQFQMSDAQRSAMMFAQRKNRFYYEEGAAVLIDSGNGVDAGTIRVMGASLPPSGQPGQGGPGAGGMRVYSKGAPATIPQLVAEVEQYNRLFRLIKDGHSVKMTVDLQVQFYDDDLQGYNTIAEIPGTDLKDEVVMIGAHLDSWHAGTGATDNGAGTAVVMEAMRLIQASGLKPRRTIRVALWTGEEQGLLGSRGYVAKYLGSASGGGFGGGQGGGPRAIEKKPAHDKFSAYYNLDNGTGQIRGIYLQGHEQLRSKFKNWLSPFWGANTVTINSTGGTDHLAFDAVGLPGFQFIQDPIEYSPRTWHTTQDVSDRILEEDLKRSSVIMAAFAFNTAMLDQKLERKAVAPTGLASLLTGIDVRAMLDEAAFRNSDLDFSICGHPIEAHEIPLEFPSVYAVKPLAHDHAE